jgi:hypothetical protein
MSQEQKDLEKAVSKLIKLHGVDGAVQAIKDMPAEGLFREMQNYPNGVFIFCNSEKGGVLVGSKRESGRPPELDGGKRVNVYLDSASLAKAAELGDGNVSEGIRIALTVHVP